MSMLRLWFMLALTVLPLAGCARNDGESSSGSDTTAVAPVPEKSKQDVTVCITGVAPDLPQARVKANGSQRVCWKGHDGDYVVQFTAANWPFDEPADSVLGDSLFIKVRKAKTSLLFTLEEHILPGEPESKHKYEIHKWPAGTEMIPPTGPEIIGEG